MAKKKGCDGVDPDNIDAYGNENGLGLTEADSIDFLTFLASESHSRGMSIGLKNGGDIIGSVIDKMQWSVNEQCAEYDECETYAAFTEVNKPVFHIEYSGETIESGGSVDTSVSAAETATDSKATSTSTAIVTPASSSSVAATVAATAAATATATGTGIATTTIDATPVSTSAAAAATSTDADATKTGRTDTDVDDEEADEDDEDDEDDENDRD